MEKEIIYERGGDTAKTSWLGVIAAVILVGFIIWIFQNRCEKQAVLAGTVENLNGRIACLMPQVEFQGREMIKNGKEVSGVITALGYIDNDINSLNDAVYVPRKRGGDCGCDERRGGERFVKTASFVQKDPPTVTEVETC